MQFPFSDFLPKNIVLRYLYFTATCEKLSGRLYSLSGCLSVHRSRVLGFPWVQSLSVQRTGLKQSSVILRSFAESRKCWPHLLVITILNIFSSLLALLYPLPMKIAVDCAIGRQPLPRGLAAVLPSHGLGSSALAISVGLLLSIALLAGLQGLAIWLLQTYVGEKLVWDFRAKLLNHVQRLSLAFHDHYGASDSVYRIQHDAPSIQYVAIQGIIPLLMAALTLAGMLLISIRIDPAISLVALAITPILFVLSLGCSRLVRLRSRHVKELDSSALSVVQEVLGFIRTIKAFGQEHREYERFVRHSSKRLASQVRLARLQATFNTLIGLVIAAGTAAALYIGVRHVRAGVLSVGSLLVVMAYIVQMYQPLQALSTKTTDLQSWLASLERTFSLLDQPPEIEESARAIPLAHASGNFEFRNVSFRYGNSQRGVENISFSVPAGSRVGIVGETGAGKTTLLNLIMRFYDTTEGQILLDGNDIREYRIADLRRQFATVLQEPVLLDASIAENIAYGKPTASDEEIVAAAQCACAHEFISSLPEQYESGVGERGARLSGGERQRVSLARAFLRDSPILILDEPTSSVDVTTEESILAATERLMQNRTTFMIAHRLNMLRSCDTILVLEQGRLVEVRTPQSNAQKSAYVASASSTVSTQSANILGD